MKKIFISLAIVLCSMTLLAQNPYLPLWEYIPDGEPHVFEDPDCPGKYRVYVYGSHDILENMYCGFNQVVWSAPVDNLCDWRYDGVAFESLTDRDGKPLGKSEVIKDKDGDLLFAPDVAMKVGKDGHKKYYLYPNVQGSRHAMVAESDRPDGPFKVCNWSKEKADSVVGILRFDPAVLVDDDGSVYAYWGNERCHMAELNPDNMADLKPGTEIHYDIIPGHAQDNVFRYFEGASIRKIEDKYILSYCRKTADGDFGMGVCNYTLAYCYSDSPFGPFTYGGTLIDGRARDKDENGNTVNTAYIDGNTHGGLTLINGKMWVFYHRQTGHNEFSRQAMVAPLEYKIEKGKGGKVIISEGEYNSEGFKTEGLDPLCKSAAGWACYYTHPEKMIYIWPVYDFPGSFVETTRVAKGTNMDSFSLREPYCPIANNTSGSIVGYKYFNFSRTAKFRSLSLTMTVLPEGVDGTITVMVGGPTVSKGGKEIAQFRLSENMGSERTKITAECRGLNGLKGKQPLFFVFDSPVKGKSLCKFYDFQFFCE